MRRLTVGEQDDVLATGARDGERLVRGVERREDLGAAAGLDARDVALDARAMLAGVMRTTRVGVESNAMTSMRSSDASVSTVALAAAFAISIGRPVIDPERSITRTIATCGSSRRFSASMRTGKMRSIVVWYQPPRP